VAHLYHLVQGKFAQGVGSKPQLQGGRVGFGLPGSGGPGGLHRRPQGGQARSGQATGRQLAQKVFAGMFHHSRGLGLGHEDTKTNRNMACQ